VRVEVKFCGLTRPDDARKAAELGARYVGAIFAGGPRNLEPARAREVLDGAGAEVERVGVFGRASADSIARVVRDAHLDIVQLHDDPTVDDIAAVRAATGARIWAVVRVDDSLSSAKLRELWQQADALVLDSKASGALGGSGVSFDWSAAATAALEHPSPLVVAGGLGAGNVMQAIEALSPEIVDVSSGVESSPGIKDHARMTEFINAVRRAAVPR
jgi:phosphoribosylanthranilate isomerase